MKKSIIESILEGAVAPSPGDTEFTCPAVNKAGYKPEVYLTDRLRKTIICENIILGDGHPELCPLMTEPLGSFDFWNEFEWFVKKNDLTCKEYKWGSSLNLICAGDRILETDTMTLHKVIGFNDYDGRSQIYFDVD